MKWNTLNQLTILDEIKEQSKTQKVLIFKHSTTCSISAMALSRLERSWSDSEMTKLKPYYLDLLKFREISNKIAQEFEIKHESPQVLIIENGVCVYDSSHNAISYQEIKKNL
jgi:bacillithiol system protein YtxJ